MTAIAGTNGNPGVMKTILFLEKENHFLIYATFSIVTNKLNISFNLPILGLSTDCKENTNDADKKDKQQKLREASHRA